MSPRYQVPKILSLVGSHPVARLPKEGLRLDAMTLHQWISQGVALQGPRDEQVEPCHQLRYEQREVDQYGRAQASEPDELTWHYSTKQGRGDG